jgi:hypothetical protein
MTFISDRYDVYPVMDHPARATLDLYIVSICNDLAGKFDFLGKSFSFFRVIEPRDRRRMRVGFARSCGEAIWPALRCRQPVWGLSSLALLGPLLIGPVGAAVDWPCWGCPGSRSRRSASLRPHPATQHSLPALGAPRRGSPWEPKLLSGSGAAWACARTRRPIRQRKKPANLSFSGRVGGRRSGLSDRATSGPTRRPDRSERTPTVSDR